MTEKEIVKMVMKSRKVTQEQLANRLGYTGQGVIGRLLTRGGSMRVDNLVKVMNELNYDVVIRDRLGRTEYVVDTKEEDIDALKERLAAMQKKIEELESGR